MPPPQLYSDGYNYPQAYAPPAQAYAQYDYSMQSQPQFNAYPNQSVMQPVPPGKIHTHFDSQNFHGFRFAICVYTGDDFQQTGWGHPSHMAIPPPTLVIPPPIQQVPVESEEEKQKREGEFASDYYNA